MNVVRPVGVLDLESVVAAIRDALNREYDIAGLARLAYSFNRLLYLDARHLPDVVDCAA